MRRLSMTRRRPSLAIPLAAVMAVLLLVFTSRAEEATPVIRMAEITGIINPLSADYLTRAVDEAEQGNAAALLLRIDTPGGLDSAMRTMVQRILSSKVPVVVYVAPPGARAASAGLFVTMAAHVAAMAPGTNIGAAHPVSLGGGTNSTMEDKAAADAAAFIRSIAEIRNRNQEWVERAVRESVSATATEALQLRVVDLLADDVASLIKAIDGLSVTTAAGNVTLKTAGARVDPLPMNPAEEFLHTITSPEIALALISIGTIGIIAELYHPGMWFPGIGGVISLLLAWVALGSLPTNWGGAALLVLAFVLLLAEVHSPGVGAFAAGGAASFVLGALLLFRPVGPISPSAPEVTLNPGVIFAIAVVAVVFALTVVRALMKTRRGRVLFGSETLVGQVGSALHDIDPEGMVHVGGEDWTAIARDRPVAAGQPARVVAVEGVTLLVEPAPDDGLLPSSNSAPTGPSASERRDA